jgi:hypothetical protein
MPRKKRDVTGQVESLNDWMARVDRQVEEAARKMERKSHARNRPGVLPGTSTVPAAKSAALRDVDIPVLVFEERKLNPELRQRLERLIEHSQKHVMISAEYREVAARLEKQRARLIQITEWIHDEYARICRELNPEGAL